MTGLTAGEAWAADALERLRAQRFAPSAQHAFLKASYARAEDVRAARPGLVCQARRWELVGACATGALLAIRRPFSPRFALVATGWWGSVSAMLEWHLGMVESEQGVPQLLGRADALTLARAWAVPVLLDRPHPAVIVLAGASDALDGRLARAGTPTRAGRDLEGLVDAVATVAATAGLVRVGKLSRRSAGLEAARVLTGTAYATVTYFARARRPGPGTPRAARMTTPVRVGGLALASAGRDRRGRVLTGASLASLGLLASSFPRARS